MLGKGTFSTVYEASMVPGDKRIALKIVRLSDAAGDRETVQDCINEINNLKVSVNGVYYWDPDESRRPHPPAGPGSACYRCGR